MEGGGSSNSHRMPALSHGFEHSQRNRAEPPGQYIIPHRLTVRVRDAMAAISAARSFGFDLTTWFDVPLDPLADFRAEPDYRLGQCPECERAAREVVLIPTGPRITPRVEWRIERFFRSERESLAFRRQNRRTLARSKSKRPHSAWDGKSHRRSQ